MVRQSLVALLSFNVYVLVLYRLAIVTEEEIKQCAVNAYLSQWPPCIGAGYTKVNRSRSYRRKCQRTPSQCSFNPNPYQRFR